MDSAGSRWVRRALFALVVICSVTAGLLGLGVAGATAASASGVVSSDPAPTITLSSTQAGSAADITADLQFSYASGGDTLKAITVTLPPGLWAAPAALASTCSSAQLTALTCPASAQIGSGVAELALANPLASLLSGALAQTAMVSLYLMPGDGADAAGVGAIIRDSALGVTLSATGTATVINTSTGAPQLQMTLSGLPQSVSGGLLSGLTAIQVTALQLKIFGHAPAADGTSEAGGAFIHLPTACGPATITVAVDTYAAAADGSASDTFTPTGCPLPLAPHLSVAATRDSADSGTAFASNLAIPAGDSALRGLTLRIPAMLIGPSAQYARVDCATSAPFSGCPVIGSVTATTPLTTAPLTGSVYLIGSITNLGLGISFPPPYALSFSGHLTLASPYVVTFTDLPDIPLTGLRLAFPGGSGAPFVAVCSAHGTRGTVTGRASGSTGVGASLSAPLSVGGCPAAATSTLSFSLRLSTATRGQAKGSPLKALKLRLPRGLSFSSPAVLRGAVQLRGATDAVQLDHGVLVISLRRAARHVLLSVTKAGITVGAGAPRRPRLRVTETAEDGQSTNLNFTLGLQR